MRNKKFQFCIEGKLIGPSQAGGDSLDTAVGTATDLFVHHALPYMANKTVEMGRYYGSEALRNNITGQSPDFSARRRRPNLHSNHRRSVSNNRQALLS